MQNFTMSFLVLRSATLLSNVFLIMVYYVRVYFIKTDDMHNVFNRLHAEYPRQLKVSEIYLPIPTIVLSVARL